MSSGIIYSEIRSKAFNTYFIFAFLHSNLNILSFILSSMKNGKKYAVAAAASASALYLGFQAAFSNPYVWQFFEEISPVKGRTSVEDNAVMIFLPVIGLSALAVKCGINYLQNYGIKDLKKYVKSKL